MNKTQKSLVINISVIICACPVIKLLVFCGISLWLIVSNLEASSWSKFRATTDNTGMKSEQVYPPLVKQWESEITGGIVASPVVRNGLVYVCSRDGFLRALDMYTGEEKWNFATQGWIDATPIVSTTTIYINSRDGKIYCLRSNYAENESVDPLWQYDTGGQNTSSLNLYANRLYFGTGYPGRKVIALDTVTGSQVVWEQTMEQFTNSSPAVAEGCVCIGASDGKMYCFDAVNGTLKWTYQTIGSFGYASPLIYSGRVYFAPGDDDFKMYCVDLVTGNKVWESSDLGSPGAYVATYMSSPGFGVDKNGNNRLLITGGNTLYALNTSSGNIVWQRAIGNPSSYGIVSSPAIVNDVVYVGSGGDKKIYAIDLNNGDVIWSYSMNSDVVCSPAATNGWVYAGTIDGKFYALQVDTATGRATSITEPDNESIVKQSIPVRGYAVNPNLTNYKLEYGYGLGPSTWTQVNISTIPVADDLLAVWEAGSLPDGNYTLKLSVTDSLSQSQTRINQAINYVALNNPPIAPTGVTVIDVQNDEGGKLNLLWTKSVDDGTGNNDVTEYRIYRSTYNGGFVLKDTVVNNTTFYQDLTATKKTTFYYLVRAYDSGQNESTDSDVVILFSVDNLPPGAPGGVTALPGDGFVNISWNPNSESDIWRYEIYQDSGSGYNLLTRALHPQTTYQNTDLVNGVTYYYRITATDDSYLTSGYSYPPASVFPYAGADGVPPSVVADLSAFPGNSEGEVILSWTVPGDDGMIGTLNEALYQIKYSTITSDTWWTIQYSIIVSTNNQQPGTTNNYPVNGLVSGNTYYFWLRVADNGGNWNELSNKTTSWSQRVSPSAVTDLIAFMGATEGTVVLSWTSPGDNGNTGSIVGGQYKVVYTSDVTKDVTTAEYSITWTTSTIPGIKQNKIVSEFAERTTYYFWLQTGDEVLNWSLYSNTAQSIAHIVPSAVTDLVTFPGTAEGTIVLSWTSPGNDGDVGTITNGQYKVIYTSDAAKDASTAEYSVIWTTTTVPGIKQNKMFNGFRERTTYYFWIQAADGVVNWSSYSNNSQSVAQGIAPSAITDFLAVSGSSMGEINLSWTAPGNDGTIGTLVPGSKFKVQSSTNSSEPWSVDYGQITISTSGVVPLTPVLYTLSALSSGVTYYFRIWTADDVPNWSAISNETSSYAQMDLIPPAAPQNLVAVDTPNDYGGTVDIFWAKSGDDGAGINDVTEYWIFRTTTSGNFSMQPVTKLVNNTTYYQDTGLTNKIVCYYIIRAYDGRNLSVPSNQVQVTPVSSWSSVDAESGGTVTTSEGLEIIFNPGTLSQNDAIFVKKLANPDVEYKDVKVPKDAKALNEAWEIKSGTTSTTLQKMAILKIPYDKNEIIAKNMKEENLRMYWWSGEGNTGEWKMLNSAEPRPAEGRVVADGISHFSFYRIMEFVPTGDVITKEETYAYPNPARQTDMVWFKYKLNYNAEVKIDVYTVSGEPVTNLSSPKTDVQAGRVFEVSWDIRNIASGIYVYRVEARADSQTKVIVKKVAVVH